MRKILLASFFLIFFGGVMFAQGTGGKITGKVIFGGDKSPLHQVSVKIAELNRTTVTDDNGIYTFENVPAGKYKLIAHQEGFADSTVPVTVAPNGTATGDIELNITGINEEVTVTGSGTEQSTFESIATVSNVDSTEIISRAAIGLGDVLDKEAGVAKRSAGPATSRPVIRGFDGDRVLVSTDGVSVGSLASQSGDHSEPVDTLAVERIEVVKGPATLLYGSNAIGGVVNAISGHDEGAHPGFRGYFSGLGGTNNAQAGASGGMEYGLKNWMFWGNGSAQRTSDYSAGGDFGTVFNTFSRSATAALGTGYFGKKAYFTTNYNYYQSRYGIPLDFREEDPEVRTIPMHRHDLKFNFGVKETGWFVSDVKFTVDLSRYQHQEVEDDVVGTTFHNNVFSYRGMFEQKQYGKLSGRFGFNGFHRDFSTVGIETLIDGPVKHDSFAVFGLEEFKFERLSLQLGARVENNRYDPVNPALLDRSFTGFSGAVGARFDLWKGGAFVANYSHGYRAPALEELYNNGPHDGTLLFEVGNANLHPEISNGIDLSLRHQTGRVKAEANFYYYHFKDFVFLAPTDVIDQDSGFPFAFYLQDDSRFVGTELSLDVKVHKYFNVFTGLDYVSAELTNGRPLPRIPPLRGRIGLDFRYEGFSVKPELVMVDRQDKLFIGETPTAGYATFNILGTYTISRQHNAHIFTVNGFNLNNKLYYNHISFIKDISPEIGRGVRFSYTARFF